MFDSDLQLQRFIESLGFLRVPPLPVQTKDLLVVQPKYHHVVHSPVMVEIKVEPLDRV